MKIVALLGQLVILVAITSAPAAFAQRSCGTAACQMADGRCGTQACTQSCVRVGGILECDDHWGNCVANVETCNGVDDDCDGATDENLTQACCGDGAQSCSGGTWGSCKRTCYVCSRASSQTCTNGLWADCTPLQEICNSCDDDRDPARLPDNDVFCPPCKASNL